MQKKMIEAVKCFTKKSRKKAGINVDAKVYEFKGENTLLVDFCDKEPFFRVCIDGVNFTTYFFREVKIGKYSWNSHTFKKGFCQYTIGKLFADFFDYSSLVITQEATKTIINYFGSNTKKINYSYGKAEWFNKLEVFECDISQAKNEKSWKKRMERRQALIERDTGKIKKPSATFEKWAIKHVEKHYLQVQPFYGEKESVGECTNCHSSVSVKKGTDVKKCPCCGKKITVVKTKNKLNGYSEQKEVILLQKIDDSLIQRHFCAERWLANNYEKYNVWEKGVYVLRSDGELKTYYAKYNSWTGKNFYDDTNLSGMYKIRLERGIVYPFGDMFKNTEFKYSALELVGDVDPISYLARYKVMPQIEMLAKVGLTTLAKTISQEDVTETYKKPWEMLKINKEEFNRLRAMNGSICALKWMQFENATGSRCDDEDIKWASEMTNKGWSFSCTPEDFDFVTNKMSLKQIRNYVTKQMELYDRSYSEIHDKWRDYFDMATVAKKNMDLEVNYKPKNIVAAHDELADSNAVNDRYEKLIELFPTVNEICETLKKYEYSDENYSIVAPMNIKDILREGRILGHCLDRSNIYFDRISRKESFIVFLRKNGDLDMPYYTLEIEPDGTTRQKRTTGDKQDEDFKKECLPFIRKWQKALKGRLTKEDEELASTSAVLREEEFEKLRKDGNKIWHGVLAGKLLVDVLEDDLMLA